jgi:hypothetical protein
LENPKDANALDTDFGSSKVSFGLECAFSSLEVQMRNGVSICTLVSKAEIGETENLSVLKDLKLLRSATRTGSVDIGLHVVRLELLLKLHGKTTANDTSSNDLSGHEIHSVPTKLLRETLHLAL